MSLTFRSGAISVAFGKVSFFMADHRKTVRVDVSQALLCEGGSSPPPKTKADYMQRLAQHLCQFIKIATVKYLEGDYRMEVRVLVVEITQADLNQDGRESGPPVE
jgi:hypothetical protein